MSDQLLDLINLTIPAKPDYVSIARLTISGIANRMGFSYDEIEDLKLAVAEACTNAVDHAANMGDGEIKVSCNIFANRLEIEVGDRRNSYDTSKIEEGHSLYLKPTMSTLRERRLGLYLMKTLVDDIDIRGDNRVVVTMTKYIRKEMVKSHGDSSTSRPSN
jgi:serine/threonine-protein kinase RsbW